MSALVGATNDLLAWVRVVAVAVLCALHGVGVVAGFVKGGDFLWIAVFGAAMLGVLALMSVRRSKASKSG